MENSGLVKACNGIAVLFKLIYFFAVLNLGSLQLLFYIHFVTGKLPIEATKTRFP
jgi:hypothetical protein